MAEEFPEIKKRSYHYNARRMSSEIKKMEPLQWYNNVLRDKKKDVAIKMGKTCLPRLNK